MQVFEEEWKVIWVDTYSIKTAGFNPPSRVNQINLVTLEAQIRMAGKILVPLALTCDGLLADGHRRLAVAKKLGMLKVPCHVYEECSQQKLWAELNKGLKPVLSPTWVEAYSHGLELQYFPEKQRTQMAALQRLLNKDEFKQFVSQKRSPGILESAYYVAHYCGDSGDEFVHEILIWSMMFQQMQLLKHAILDGLSSDSVIEIILTKRKMLRYG